MKFKDYYQVLGIERNATLDEVKQAYRKLAHKYHPDVSKDPHGEEKFKDIAEAYTTLKDSEKRAAYDQLGRHRQGEDFVPPQDWQNEFRGFGGFGKSDASFADVDLADLLAAFAASRHGGGSQPKSRRARHGQDYEVSVPITLEQIYEGAETDVTVALPEYDENGLLHHAQRTFRVRVPKGATDGQRLRLSGKGGQGINGGKNGDLYLVMSLTPHSLYRISGQDLYLDLPLAPWEAVLGASVEVPTLGGTVELKIAPGTTAGRQLRLAKRGLPTPSGGKGDLFAVVKIEVPTKPSPQERELLSQLAAVSSFNPRKHFFSGVPR